MKLKIVWILIAVLLFGTAMIAAAQDESPAESPEDNACYTGGSLEGKCDWPTDAEDDWAWNCGWYVARVDTGVIAISDIPAWCDYEEIIDVTPTCYDSADGGRPDFLLTGAVGTIDNVTFYESIDGTCTGLTSGTGTVVAAVDGADADSQCAALLGLGYTGGNVSVAFQYLNAPANWYGCTIPT